MDFLNTFTTKIRANTVMLEAFEWLETFQFTLKPLSIFDSI